MYVVTKPYADPGMQRKLEWVARMLDASEASAAKIGCSPEAIVAQAAQETGWGRSAIGNNVFGIKASSGWKGAVVMRPTWEVENGVVVVRPINYLALSYDHRIIDGREAVLGLVAMKEALEDPSRLLFDI